MNGARVLVVDDEEDVRYVLARFLRARGHTVQEAADGPRALEVWRVEPCEVLVTDLRMPGMDGAELVRRLRQHDPGLPVIVVSADICAEATARALALEGYCELLAKPICEWTGLARAIERALAQRREGARPSAAA